MAGDEFSEVFVKSVKNNYPGMLTRCSVSVPELIDLDPFVRSVAGAYSVMAIQPLWLPADPCERSL